ncbi:dethiobiotin synthase [Desulforhopalus singaporensis]|uniref:ATP-dependent dethiobiotin synthetase BioD n=1 Tax=Desulforhopalus singaporensis TaxID=91360 RepID=A0A1H0VEU3_9BACT|nr:dethiobiotin synthase [Desulforhopalus singaporensis]SDP76738.1 dethiobiotin synthase [Desulforhopalus singaporensis]
MDKGTVFCITGIDTDIGKTVATGLIARGLLGAGRTVITQKAVQTGCDRLSEDILSHRDAMGCGILPEDEAGLTCPYLFSTPCSPHLAARIESAEIFPDTISRATDRLCDRYDVVLLEGAGGLFVPLQTDYTLIDYLSEMSYPVILVTSSKLGSLNHTFASFEALQNRQLNLAGVIYNRYGESDQRIGEDSLYMITRHLGKYGFSCPVIEMHEKHLHQEREDCIKFSTICTDKGEQSPPIPGLHPDRTNSL